jgi:ABC-type multidrug transport system fused ATPase/permease subunit
MLARARRLLNRFFSKSRTINNEPLNKVSLIVIILVDIFILINVFVGLDDISRWYLSPSEVYPCYSDWKNYRTQTAQDKDYEIVKLSLPSEPTHPVSFQQNYQNVEAGHLGRVSASCLTYASYQDKIRNPANQQIIKTIEQKQTKISDLEQTNRTIRAQYDSTLLEKIAGQASERSINAVRAEKAKQELDQNNRTISTLTKELSTLKSELVAKPESASFITFLKDAQPFGEVEQGYQQASFWYPSIQFVFQALFLLPMILVAFSVHKFSQRKGYGLISLISWHLLVIFFIPLIFKVFEFLQVGALFHFIFDIISALFGGLLFLISYVYILLIPLVGFGIIKFFQRFVANPKIQAATRIQNSNCIQCARRIRHQDTYCPHCGYYQYVECQNCHDLTYKHLPYCKQCGHSQEIS